MPSNIGDRLLGELNKGQLLREWGKVLLSPVHNKGEKSFDLNNAEKHWYNSIFIHGKVNPEQAMNRRKLS